MIAVADGVESSPMAQRASRVVLESLAAEISSGADFDVRTIRRVHGRLCDALAKGKTFGSSTTLAAIEYQHGQCKVLSIGDSRAYRISADGDWQQLSRDHTILNSMIDSGEADADMEYASFYGMLDSCLVADDEETDFPVHRSTTQLLPNSRPNLPNAPPPSDFDLSWLPLFLICGSPGAMIGVCLLHYGRSPDVTSQWSGSGLYHRFNLHSPK